ncbi:hypothetical protein LEP1GSC047_2109 [Leptospira inadai serovar Lyme str. 10]|uniref:Lipoprotein n=3 Tax=Leptospira inadai TaxID=29506 RepID=V6HZT3_9LEPT|nr:hypothetical protein [Leptospira inadai]EQA38524.1 hypothetical protein LEP1GSC047_2109 [Leptospira inadai serovar Lyme str. 10]PNV72645.1 hypothetical protein BES34_018835 [Leptospira inadai serovar Lyme]
MNAFSKFLFISILLITLVNGCKKSSSDDQSSLLALALAQNKASCVGATAITKGGAAVTGGATAGYFYYLYTSAAGTTDTVTFSSTPSGGAGNILYIGKSNIIINASNVGTSSNFDAFFTLAPYTNNSVTTSAGNFRCFVVQVQTAGTSYSLTIN